ncbi:MAG: phage tail assembly protein [Pseudolabrys sp.]
MADDKSEGEKVSVALSKPVKAHGDEVSELSFREPTVADIEAAGGNPVLLDMASDPPKADFDARRMVAMLSRLGDVPVSTIRMMNSNDFASCCWAVSGFFVPR